MTLFRYCLGLLILAASPVAAADKLAFGPTPVWVVPVEIGKPVTPAGDAPVQNLLVDQQLLFEPRKVTTYSRVVMKVQTAQGLSAGNISLPWRPEFDAVTVHSLRLLRGGKVMDVLGTGQTFSILRREEGLESAMLDGVLTANIQPEGLQAGDIIDLAISTASIDPTLGPHAQEVLATWNGMRIARGHVSALWPTNLPIRVRFAGGLPEAKIQRRNGLNSIDLTMDDLSPSIAPKGAPPRFGIGRALEMTSYGSWADVSATFAPLYSRASVIPPKGPLRDEVERIRNSTPDPLKRAEAALNLVQQRIRYVALSMGTAGLVPATAEETWARRFGDCKAKTALLLGMLREYGIEAVPVAVNLTAGDGINERLPMPLLFDHVLVRAKIAGREYWLDGTEAGPGSLSNLSIPNLGFGLEITEMGGKLVRMVAPPLDLPSEEIAIRLDAHAGIKIPAPAEIELIYRGDQALGLQAILAQLPDELREQALREIWKSKYDFIDVASVTNSFNQATGELRLTMKGSARMDWSGDLFEIAGTGLGVEPYWQRAPGPGRAAPVAVSHPWYSRVRKTILLPRGFTRRPPRPTPEVDVKLAGIHYTRRAAYKDDIFSVTSEQRSLVPEISYAVASADEKALRELRENVLFLRVPSDYRPTEGELAAMLSEKPTSAKQFIDRGHLLNEAGRLDEAIKDFNQAIALEPQNDLALANRGIALVWKKDFAAAAKSLDAAESINPKNAVVHRARGLMAEQKGANAEAVKLFTRSLELDPGNLFALTHRAQAHSRLGDHGSALADSAAALEIDPGVWGLRLLRATIFLRQGRTDLAGAEAEALLRLESADAYPQVAAAAILTRLGKKTEAAAAFERALAIKPSAFVYVNRAQQRPKKEYAARMADVDAALKLEPNHADSLAMKANLLEEKGDWGGAAALLSRASAVAPAEVWPLIRRGIALFKLGRIAEADQDFKKAVAIEPTATTWNNLCWSKATSAVALEQALGDCDRALKLVPDNRTFIDSRGLVLLRLGRLDEAIGTYDRALAKGPMVSALIGRALAYARKGDAVRSKADRAAAEKIDPNAVEQFERYGLSF